MKIIDLDALFKAYLREYITNHASLEKKEDVARLIIETMDELYANWLDAPCNELDNQKPKDVYFEKDEKELLKIWIEHFKQDIIITEPLLDAITQNKKCANLIIILITSSEPTAFLKAIECSKIDTKLDWDKIKLEATDLLKQIDVEHNHFQYIEIIANGFENEFFIDELQRIVTIDLIGMDEKQQRKTVQTLIDSVESATTAGKERLCNALCEIEAKYFKDKIYNLLVGEFENFENQAYKYAALLSRFGEPKAALPIETAINQRRFLNFHQFKIMKDALENLGGVVSDEFDFSTDKDYIEFSKKNKLKK